MSAATVAQSSGSVGAFATMASTHSSSMTAVQSGPYTKTQFQHTMEGSRTIKSSKEVEQLLRDYPAALELYRTGKYKVKVKCDVDVERVILVEKRVTKTATTNPSSAADENQENNQTVPDISKETDRTEKEERKEEAARHSRSRTQSHDRVAPTVSTNGNTLVPTAMSSIRMTSNTQPKVEHHRTPSRDRDVSATPPQKTRDHKRSQSRDNQYQGTFGKQQGKQIHQQQQNMMIPYVPNASNPAQLWQQQRPMQPYYSNPLLQQQQQQPQKPVPTARNNFYMPSPFVPQQNQLYRQPFYYGQRPAAPVPFPAAQSGYPLPPPSTRSIGKSSLYSTNNYTSSRSVSNTLVLPPSFRTFHAHQQPVRPFHPIYQPQIPCPVPSSWLSTMANEPISALVNPHVAPVEQRCARNRARSVDVGLRNQSVPARSAFVQQQAIPVHEYRSQQRAQPGPMPTPAGTDGKDQTSSSKEPASSGSVEKLTVRQLNESFKQASSSGRVPYSALPAIIQRFGILLTENDVLNAAKELDYNVHESISARRFVHILVKLGKITKSTQPQLAARQPASPSILPEDREVKDIMTQRKTTITHGSSSDQPNPWN